MASRMPEDPVVRSLVNMVRQQQFNRRQVLRGAAVAGAGAGALGLASCSSGGSGGGENGSIVWGNWTYYLDFNEETGSWDSLDAFMEETGIDVQYVEDIDDLSLIHI